MENTKKVQETNDIVILVNGPGELSSYVRPTVDALIQRKVKGRIILVFTPCPYSTGKEAGIARAIPGVSHVIDSKEFINWALFRIQPKNIRFAENGIVVFMGGDILHGKLIAKRLKYPAIAYSEAYAKWPKIYRKFLVPDRLIFDKFRKQGFPDNQLKIVGNLMADSVKATNDRSMAFKALSLDPGRKLVSFMPGSREFQIRFTLLFFSKVAFEMRKKDKDLQFAYIISPYLPPEQLEKYIKKAGLQAVGNRLHYNNDVSILMVKDRQHDAIAASDLVITIPGTNTAEVAVLGAPMIVVFPLDNPKTIPLEGIYEILGKIPLLGFILKYIYVKIALFSTKYFAIPNIKAGSEIVPEMKGDIKPDMLAEKASMMLKDPGKLNQMRALLKECLGGPGAAQHIAEEIDEIIS